MFSFIGIEYFYQEPVSLVMEHIDGENLDVLVKREGRLDENFIKAYSVQILDAIIYMHSCNIIHRYFIILYLSQQINTLNFFFLF